MILYESARSDKARAGRGYLVRPYRKGDELGIFQLWQAVYPSKSRRYDEWLKWWRWMYMDNPAGKGIIWLAENDGRILSHFALIPTRMLIKGREVLGCWGSDAMTHPDNRRRGMYEAVSEPLWADASSAGIEIVPGFPNDNSRPILVRKFGWFEIGRTPLYFKPLNWNNFTHSRVEKRILADFIAWTGAVVIDKTLLRTLNAPLISGLEIKQIDKFDERFDEHWSRIAGQYQAMVIRDKTYLNWRFSHPQANYTILAAEKRGQIQGYIVIGNASNTGVSSSKSALIFDLVAESEGIMRHLVCQGVQTCRSMGMDSMAFGLLGGEVYHRALKASGFINLPFKKGSLACVHRLNENFSKSFLSDPDNWLFQLADTDIVWNI